MEREARKHVLAACRCLRRKGETVKRAAERLGTSARTLYRWGASWRQDRLAARPRGRPAPDVPASVRNDVIAVLVIFGKDLGIAALQCAFPFVPRSALVDLARRFRHHAHRKLKALLHVLRWHRVGAVWAIDFTDPPGGTIERIYTTILLVRDLASGEILTSIAVPGPTAWITVVILESLIRWFGAPLVIKVDHGSAFISEEVWEWAERHGVRILYSPVRMPSYNGGIEAGGGSVKTRAWHHAARHGRPAEWTLDDVEAGRLEANALGRPRGRDGPTPDELWRDREPIAEKERELFAAACRRLEIAERRDRGIGPDVELPRHEQAHVDRAVLVRALLELGYLSIRRRRITPPKKHRRGDRIT